ncbi:glycosyltransferase [Candidatus Woesearchaeota archaeon]|nr:MAG: glycosyltransferase [Candidatus Woesearchaeota archaeon]
MPSESVSSCAGLYTSGQLSEKIAPSPSGSQLLENAAINRTKLKIENNVKIFDQYVPNEEVGKYYTACDVVVLPYISATNSGIVQTAFGFNKPVIVTNAGGLPDVVIDDVTGYIVPTENSKAIAKAVIKFYNNRDKINFEENIEKDKKRFEWDRLVELIESFMI